jgi:ATP-binding cassette, subfamily C, bacterial LapB
MARGSLRSVLRAVPKRSWNRMEVLLQSFAINLFGLAMPIFILQIYDRVLPLGAAGSLYVMVGGLTVVIIFDIILKLARSHIITWNGAQFEHLARLTALDKVFRSPLELYERSSPGDYLERINAIGAVKDFYSSQIVTLFVDLPFAVLFLTVIWYLGGYMVLVPLTLLTVFGLLALIVGSQLRRSVNERTVSDNRRYDFLIEVLNGIHTIKAMNLKTIMERRFERLQERTAHAIRRVTMTGAYAQGMGSLFTHLNMSCVVGFGALMILNGELSAGKLAACMLLSGRALQPMQSAMSLWTNYQTVRVAAGQVSEVLRLPEEAKHDLPDIPPVIGELELKNVCFAYGDAPEPFIKNANLIIGPGEIISIEGANSSGRTTLLLLILGLLKPQSGQILVDGNDIFEFNPISVRRELSLLSHNAPLYSGNLIENMTSYQWGDAISAALDLAAELGLEEEIKVLPEGYDTKVGGSTVERIPAGIRQRVALVRALVDRPKLILFDEANLSLDAAADKRMQDLLLSMKGECTMILVSHREDILALADRHYVMVDGELRPKMEGEVT